GRTEEIPVVRREHDRVAVFGADDPRKTILKSPGHFVTSWSKSLELVSRINPFAARLGWQRHGPGTVLRLPRDHYRKVAKAAEEFREHLKKHELAPLRGFGPVPANGRPRGLVHYFLPEAASGVHPPTCGQPPETTRGARPTVC